MHNVQGVIRRAPAIKHQPRSKRSYFDVSVRYVCRARILEEHTASSRWLSRPA